MELIFVGTEFRGLRGLSVKFNSREFFHILVDHEFFFSKIFWFLDFKFSVKNESIFLIVFNAL